jgi:hypothetical protein
MLRHRLNFSSPSVGSDKRQIRIWPRRWERSRKLSIILKIDLKKLFKGGVKEQEVEQVAAELGLDKKVFSFFIQNSARPSIEAGME